MKNTNETTNIPQNEEEAIFNLERHDKSEIINSCLFGIFQNKIQQGENFLQAYNETLLMYSNIIKS